VVVTTTELKNEALDTSVFNNIESLPRKRLVQLWRRLFGPGCNRKTILFARGEL
jgi:hypothetical protein